MWHLLLSVIGLGLAIIGLGLSCYMLGYINAQIADRKARWDSLEKKNANSQRSR